MKAEKNMTTGSAAPSKKRAQYWKSLRFLDTVDDERDTFSNAIVEPVDDPDIQIDSVEEQLEEVVDEHTETVHVEPTQAKECQIKRHAEPSTSTKQDKRVRKDKDIVRLLKARSEERNETMKRLDLLMTPESADEIDLFFTAMAATVKKFNPRLKTEAKMKVFNLITRMEMENHNATDAAQCLNNFMQDSSLSASTSASPYSNEYLDIDPVEKILNCPF